MDLSQVTPMQYYDAMLIRLSDLAGIDGRDVEAQKELVDLVDLIVPFTKAIGKIDEMLKEQTKRILTEANLPSLETGYIKITPVTKIEPTELCMVSPEWLANEQESDGLKLSQKKCDDVRKKLLAKNGYSLQKVSHFMMRNNTTAPLPK